LAAVAAADTPRLLLGLDPSLFYIASPFPIDRIWAANQPGADPDATIDLDAGGVALEVRRRGAAIVHRALTPADFAFRAAIAAGSSLESAAEAGFAADAAFDLGFGLTALFEENAVISFGLAERRES